MKPRKIVLSPFETMQQARAKDRLAVDATKVVVATQNHPGIRSKEAIAEATGLDVLRVADVIRRINRGETGHTRLYYGAARATGGPYAGLYCWGWFVQDKARHHSAMEFADVHEAVVELGLRRGRLVRLAYARGLAGPSALRIVAALEENLGLTLDALSTPDYETFEALAVAEFDDEAEGE